MLVVVIAILLLITVPIFTRLFWEMYEAKQALGVFNQVLIAKDYQKAYGLAVLRPAEYRRGLI